MLDLITPNKCLNNMSTIREFPINSSNPLRNWANAVRDNSLSNTLHGSSDVLLKRTIGGSSINIHPKYKYVKSGLSNIKEYDPTSKYSIGDVVVVHADKTYELSAYISSSSVPEPNDNDNFYSDTSYGSYSSTTIDVVYNGIDYTVIINYNIPSPGTYICVNDVPGFYDYLSVASSSVTILSGHTLLGSQIYPDAHRTIQNLSLENNLPKSCWTYIRYININYYPTVPETGKIMSNIAVWDENNCEKVNGRYWEQIGGSSGSSINPWVVYDDKAAYKVGDQVIVDPNRTDPYPILGPTTSSAQLCYGLFQCLVTVPAWTSASLGSGSEHGRNTGSYYYPIYPTPPQGSWVLVSGSFMNRPHWQPISPMFPAQFCLGGVTTTVYVNGVVSGSVFSSHLNYP